LAAAKMILKVLRRQSQHQRYVGKGLDMLVHQTSFVILVMCDINKAQQYFQIVCRYVLGQ